MPIYYNEMILILNVTVRMKLHMYTNEEDIVQCT